MCRAAGGIPTTCLGCHCGRLTLYRLLSSAVLEIVHTEVFTEIIVLVVYC